MDTVIRNRKNNVLVAFTGVVVVLSLLLSSCSVVNDLTDISTAGSAFLAALGKGDAAGAAAMMHSNAQRAGDMATALKAGFVDRHFGGFTVDNTKLENGVGELTGKCSLTDSSGTAQTGTLTVQLQKDTDGKWKVLNINCKVS
ncbi:MAG TPA: hypothetical protein VGK87_09295 [Anaerolineae bacterium]|jgi:hypothetical protein